IEKTRYYFEKGLYYYPNDQIIRFNLGQVHFYQRNFRKANKIWSTLSDTINDPTLFHLKAISAYKEQNKSLAKVYIEKAISLDSKAEYYDLLGVILHDKGRDREAMKQFKKALSLNSSLRSAQLNLSILENNSVNISQLIKSLKKELRQHPEKHLEIALQLSILYYNKRLYINAIEILENIPENQKTLKIFRHLALYYRTVSEWNNAIKILEIADKKFNIDINTQYELAETCLHAGLYTKAIKKLNKCIRLWNKNPWRLYYQLGYAHVKNNNFIKSRIYLKKSLRKKKDNIAARGLLAYVYNELGQKEKARSLWERNCKDDPHNPTIWINLGLLLEGEKQYKSAIDKFKMALSVNPDDKSVNINIGNTYEQMGMTKKALEFYIEAFQSKKRIIAVYNAFLASKKINDTLTTQMSINILRKEFSHSIYTKRANSEMQLWRGDTSSAMVSFEKLPEKNAFDWHSLARIYLAKKLFSSFKNAVKNLPDNQQWSNTKKKLRAEYVFLEGRYQEAFQIWQEIEDDSYEAQYNRAISAFYAERYRAAIQIGNQLLLHGTEKDKIDIFRLLCNSTIKLKDWRQATFYFLKMSELTPDDPLIWYNLAVTAYNQDDMTNSWKWYKKSQKIDPKIRNMDIENRYRTNLTSAKDEYLNDLDFLYNKAVKLQYSENDSAAEKLYQQILKKNEKHYRAWNNLGAIYGERAELQKAIHCYKNAISEKKDSPDGYANLVIIYLALNDIKLAEKWLRKGMHRAPGSDVLRQMKTQLQNAKMKR
ncbi:MAG: tetratricopeptide repeat protein, partial [Chitinispirillia bacterium]